MIPPVKAIVRVLWGNVELKGKKVPVVVRTYPYDKIPCITIDDSGGSAFMDRQIINEKYPLPPNHPQFDKENPFKKAPQQVLREEFETNISIHVWCNTEDEREELNNNILRLFHEAQSDHFKFCDNYHDGDCAYIDNTCYAEHFDKINMKTAKKKCPNPLVYGYENIFTTYNLIRASFYVNQPFTSDDLSQKDVVLRSIIRVHTGYYTDYIIGGITSNKIEHTEELL